MAVFRFGLSLICMFRTLYRLLQAPPGMAVDFLQPVGAPALPPADGVSWRIFANPVALFIGGVSAVLLELAEPSVRSGVWEHSNFRRDPAARLQRTGYAAMVTVYAPREAAERMIAQVVRIHDRVQGQTPEGLPYRANDPRLLRWVQATAVFGFAEAFHRYVQPLSRAELSAAFAEGLPAAQRYGAVDVPQDWPAWQALLQATAPSLQGHVILEEFLDLMENAPIMPVLLRPMQRLLVRAAVSMVPQPVSDLPQLQGRGLRYGEAAVVRLLGRMAQWLPLPGTPAAQARKRMRGG